MLRTRSGLTLVELLLVVVLLVAVLWLLVPALVCGHGRCNGRAGATAGLISQLAQAAKMYEGDYGEYPPGDGVGSRELATMLSRKGPKELPYFEFQLDMLDAQGDIINPVFGEGPDVFNKLHYRNNIVGAGAGGAQRGAMPVYKKNSFDLWGAGCNYRESKPMTAWSLRYE